MFNLSEETRKRLDNAEEEREYLRNGYGKHKGFKFWKPDPEYHLWKIEKEDGSLGLAGHFTSAVACMQAIDEFLKEDNKK